MGGRERRPICTLQLVYHDDDDLDDNDDLDENADSDNSDDDDEHDDNDDVLLQECRSGEGGGDVPSAAGLPRCT